MKLNDASFIKLALIGILLCAQANFSAARTRYEEHETDPETGMKLCHKDCGEEIDSSTCRNFCETKTDLQTGGCDCVTEKCVCANMQLNFCNFQQERLYI